MLLPAVGRQRHKALRLSGWLLRGYVRLCVGLSVCLWVHFPAFSQSLYLLNEYTYFNEGDGFEGQGRATTAIETLWTRWLMKQ